MLRICLVHNDDLIYISKEGVFDYYCFLVDWLAPYIWIWVGPLHKSNVFFSNLVFDVRWFLYVITVSSYLFFWV